MTWDELGLSWFDIAVVVLLWIGVMRGRARGISNQIVELFQWLLTVFLGVMLYVPIGRALQPHLQVSTVAAHAIAFLLVAGVVKLIAARLANAFSERLLNGDYFGSWEYPLGVVAGALIHAAMLMAALSLVRVKLVTPDEFARSQKKEGAEMGSEFLPDMGRLQAEIFRQSPTGRFIERECAHLMIQPVRWEPYFKVTEPDKKREHPVDEILSTAKK